MNRVKGLISIIVGTLIFSTGPVTANPVSKTVNVINKITKGGSNKLKLPNGRILMPVKVRSFSSLPPVTQRAIRSGGQKKTGGHDHRHNKGDDRTPSQKAGDKGKKTPR